MTVRRFPGCSIKAWEPQLWRHQWLTNESLWCAARHPPHCTNPYLPFLACHSVPLCWTASMVVSQRTPSDVIGLLLVLSILFASVATTERIAPWAWTWANTKLAVPLVGCVYSGAYRDASGRGWFVSHSQGVHFLQWPVSPSSQSFYIANNTPPWLPLNWYTSLQWLPTIKRK